MDIDPQPQFSVPRFKSVAEENAFLASEAFGEFLTSAFAEGVRHAVAEEADLIAAHRAKIGGDPA